MSETPSEPPPPPATPAAPEPVAPAAAVPPTPPAAPVYAPAAPAAPAPRGTNGFGIAALILGIIAILGAAFPFINIVSGILAVAGLIFGIIGLTRKGTGKGTSIAGTIISGIALIITIIASIIFFATINAVIDSAEDEPIVIEETEAPEPDPIPVDPDAVLGSFENPVPLGTGVTISLNDVEEWLVTVEGSVLNADDLVAAADPSNPAPEAGYQYALVNIRFERVGTGPRSPSEDLAIFFGTSPEDFFVETDVNAVAPERDWRSIVDFDAGNAPGNALVQIPVGSNGAWGINPVGTDLLVYLSAE